jgi:2,3-bisphosphoglycerate-dependent phosphoglycerate mutase
MQFYFIRHAQSANNALWTETGSEEGRSEDPELTKTGVQQAHAAADFLVYGNPRGGLGGRAVEADGFGISHIYSSLMVRSVKTGTIIAGRLGLRLHGWQEVHERGGIFLADAGRQEVACLPGRDRSFFSIHFPDFVLPDNFIDAGWWNRRPMETSEECVERARRFIAGLLEKHGGTDDRVAVISHGGFYNDFINSLLHLPPDGSHWFSMYNTGISRIDFREERFVIVYQNRVEHLSKDLIT